MKSRRSPVSRGAVIGLLATVCVALPAAPALADMNLNKPSKCAAPDLIQPFLGFGDQSWYATPAGETYNNFTGKGWTLTGGAQFIPTTLQDGSTGYVLDMPAGATATSPNFCLNPDYPKARAMIRPVLGSPKLSFYVTYADTGPTASSKVAPKRGAPWKLSPMLKLYPGLTPGWQLATFTFVAGSTDSEVAVYNFFVDPYSKR